MWCSIFHAKHLLNLWIIHHYLALSFRNVDQIYNFGSGKSSFSLYFRLMLKKLQIFTWIFISNFFCVCSRSIFHCKNISTRPEDVDFLKLFCILIPNYWSNIWIAVCKITILAYEDKLLLEVELEIYNQHCCSRDLTQCLSIILFPEYKTTSNLTL